ncbi:MAG: hypothetical protein ACM3X6_06215 [Patescibacteria group bacterium]
MKRLPIILALSLALTLGLALPSAAAPIVTDEGITVYADYMFEAFGGLFSVGVDFGIADGMTIGVGLIPEAGFEILTYSFAWGLSDVLALHVDGIYDIAGGTLGSVGMYYGLGDDFRVYLGGGAAYIIEFGYGMDVAWFLEAEAQFNAGDNFLLYGGARAAGGFDNILCSVGAGFTF